MADIEKQVSESQMSAFNSGKHLQNGNRQLCKMTRVVAVFNSSGQQVDDDGKGVIVPTNNTVWKTRSLFLTMIKYFNADLDEEELHLKAHDVEGGNLKMFKVFRMPSLAVADDEAARMFAENIILQVKVQEQDDGDEVFKF